MTSKGDRSKRIEELFRLGVLVPREERDAFLRRHAGDDQELSDDLAQLLGQDDEGTKDFLASPVLSGWSKGGDTSRTMDDPSIGREVMVGSRIDRIGRYQIERALGEGGMGAVYLAEQLEPVRRKVALKIVKLGMDTRRVVARFERERQALALMDHPGIARIYDGGATESGRPYFVMEYVPGSPFTDYCDRAKLDVRARLDLFVRVCEAVQHAHLRGIVHRDLKPSNVLVADRDGLPMPKVIDFGVARATADDAGERATRASEVIGTYAYMSPEQADPDGAGVGPRSDVYSLGVLLYELLTGSLPVGAEELRGKSPSEVSRLLADTDPPAPSTKVTRLGAASLPQARRRGGLDPRSLARKLSGDLDWITLKAMERDPARRYRTAAELASDVRRHLAHQAVLAGPPGPGYRARKYVHRHKLGVGACAALLLALASGAAGTALGFREARSGARQALDSEREARLALANESAERVRVEQTGAMVFRLLDLANAESTWRGDDSAVALLLQLSREIGEAFVSDPEGEARLRLNVGRALRTRGEFSRAGEELARVQDLERSYGADVAARAETSREVHRLVVDSGGHGSYAAGLAAAALTAEALAADSPATGAAAALVLKHAQDRGFEHLPDDLDALEKSFTPESGARSRLLAADVVGTAGGYLGLHFAFAEAEPLLACSLELRTAVEGPLHPEVVRGVGELVEHLLQQGRSREAVVLVDARVALFREALPGGHWLTAELESRLGECLSLEGREPEARELLVAAREALVRERGPRSRPALEAGLRLRDHYSRTGDLELARELDLALGDAREGPRARDREAAWGRTALALGADEETAAALVALLTSAQGAPEAGAGPGRDAAVALAGLVGVDGDVAALLVRALESVEPRFAGTLLADAVADALHAARGAVEPLEPEALLVEQGEPRAEQPTLADDRGLAGGADAVARALLPALEAQPLFEPPAEAPLVAEAEAEPEPEDASEPSMGPDEWVLFAWSVACPDHGVAPLYELAAGAATHAIALEPEALEYLPVLALSFARLGSGETALKCLEPLEERKGTVGTIGLAVCAMVELDAGDAEPAEVSLLAAEAAYEADPKSAPVEMSDLLAELRARLRELQMETLSQGDAGATDEGETSGK